MALGDKKNVPWSVNGILADAGGDIRVAAASIPTAGGASIETALSTKANQAEVLAALAGKADAMVILDSGDISQLVPLKSTGFVATPAVTGTPQSAWWIGSAETTGTIFRVDLTNVHYPSESHRRTYQNGNWTGWVKIPTAEPPTEYPLPLAAGVMAREGLTSLCRYSKDGFGRVCVHFSVVKVNGSAFTSMESIATLPAGCRPFDIVYGVAAAHASSPISNCGFGVYSDGRIVIYPTNDTDTKNLAGTIIFTAA